MAHSQVHLRLPFDFLARNKFQFEAACQRGDVGVHFHQGKMLAYASARPESEGQVRKAIAAFGACRNESLRIEARRIRPEVRVPLHQVGRNEDIRLGRQLQVADGARGDGSAREKPSGRIQP
jgi:hypothetical protein